MSGASADDIGKAMLEALEAALGEGGIDRVDGKGRRTWKACKFKVLFFTPHGVSVTY